MQRRVRAPQCCTAARALIVALTSGLPAVHAQQWPACPAKGCTPCPFYSFNRPNCTCFEGYSRTGQPVPGGGLDPLEWDPVQGWIGSCQPVSCGKPPHPAQSSNVDEVEDPLLDMPVKLIYRQRVRMLCDTGYRVEGWDAVDFTFGAGLAGTAEQTTTTGGSFVFDLPGQGDLENQTEPKLEEEEEDDDLYVGLTEDEKKDIENRLIEYFCDANGGLTYKTGKICVPFCGDSRRVPTDHLHFYDLSEQCDDGNYVNGDGCDRDCRVESGWICKGGSRTSIDSCEKAGLFADSSFVMTISGSRVPSIEEIESASLVALSEAFGCPRRDLEILQISTGETVEELNIAVGTTTTSTTTPADNASKYHSRHLAVKVWFRVKVSDPRVLDIDQIRGELNAPQVLLPKLLVVLMKKTTLNDVYLFGIEAELPKFEGDLALGVVQRMTIRDYIAMVIDIALPVCGYAFVLLVVSPLFTYCVFVKRRPGQLMGNFDYLQRDEYTKGWVIGICGWTSHKVLMLSLVCCLPSRIAYTWDTLGIIPFWNGVLRGFACCGLYLLGLWPCGACLVAGQRSDIKDLMGFGDSVKGNLELGDYLCYVCCPCCAVIQEAVHVDGAYAWVRPHIEDNMNKLDKQKADEEKSAQQMPIAEEHGMTDAETPAESAKGTAANNLVKAPPQQNMMNTVFGALG